MNALDTIRKLSAALKAEREQSAKLRREIETLRTQPDLEAEIAQAQALLCDDPPQLQFEPTKSHFTFAEDTPAETETQQQIENETTPTTQNYKGLGAWLQKLMEPKPSPEPPQKPKSSPKPKRKRRSSLNRDDESLPVLARIPRALRRAKKPLTHAELAEDLGISLSSTRRNTHLLLINGEVRLTKNRPQMILPKSARLSDRRKAFRSLVNRDRFKRCLLALLASETPMTWTDLNTDGHTMTSLVAVGAVERVGVGRYVIAEVPCWMKAYWADILSEAPDQPETSPQAEFSDWSDTTPVNPFKLKERVQ